MNIKTVFLTLFLIFNIYSIPPIFAQNTGLDAVFSYQLKDPEAITGDILISTDKGLMRSNLPYSPILFGILTDEPIILIQTDQTQEGSPVVRNGLAHINVTSLNGPIKRGDYITSSTIPGKGQKATTSGYVLGVSLGELVASQSAQLDVSGKQVSIGQVPVALNIQYTEIHSSVSPTLNKALRFLDNSLLANFADPEKFSQLIRYFSASIIALGGFLLSFFTFSRSMVKTVESVGRNPLAKNAIYFTLLVNVVLAILTTLIGLVTAFVILKL